MKKGLLLGALLLIGTQAMADQGTTEKRYGNWTNKLTLTGAMQTSEDFGKIDTDGDALGSSTEIGYALMYNITNRGRLGFEIGYVNQNLEGTVKDLLDTSTLDALKLGITGEYDVYSKDDMTIYLTGSFGALDGSITTKYELSNNGRVMNEYELSVQAYMQAGVGMTYKGFLVETGIQAKSYKASHTDINDKKESEDKVTESELYLSVGIKL